MAGLRVVGIPRPKGSMHCIGPRITQCPKCGHHHTVIHNVQPDDPKGLGKEWRQLLENAGHKLRRHLGGTYSGAVVVTAWFARPRLVSDPGRRWPHTPPDTDKLTRMLLDALQESAVLDNDALVCDLHIYKRFVGDPSIPAPGLDEPGVLFFVEPMTDPETLI